MEIGKTESGKLKIIGAILLTVSIVAVAFIESELLPLLVVGDVGIAFLLWK